MSTPEIILHHYWESPYAGKARNLLGFKKLAWRSVLIPLVMPKPDVTALTGGYRKTPVLQIGADVYCDTDLIARVLDRLHPDPPLFPDSSEPFAMFLGPWQQELFTLAVRRVGTTVPVFPEGFVEDRSKMVEGGYSLEKILREAPAQREQLRAKLDLLDRHLTRRPFIAGSQASLADFSVAHPVFSLQMFPQVAEDLAPFPAVRAWAERMAAFGQGTLSELSSSEAVDIARAAKPAATSGVEPGEPNGLRAGDRVTIVHENWGNDPTTGELVAASVHEIALRHRNERVGEVVVHFPREHYVVTHAA